MGWTVYVKRFDEIILAEIFPDESSARKRLSQLQHEYHADPNEKLLNDEVEYQVFLNRTFGYELIPHRTPRRIEMES